MYKIDSNEILIDMYVGTVFYFWLKGMARCDGISRIIIEISIIVVYLLLVCDNRCQATESPCPYIKTNRGPLRKFLCDCAQKETIKICIKV